MFSVLSHQAISWRKLNWVWINVGHWEAPSPPAKGWELGYPIKSNCILLQQPLSASLCDLLPGCYFKPSALVFLIPDFCLMTRFCLFARSLLMTPHLHYLPGFSFSFRRCISVCCISYSLGASLSPLLCPTWAIPGITSGNLPENSCSMFYLLGWILFKCLPYLNFPDSQAFDTKHDIWGIVSLFSYWLQSHILLVLVAQNYFPGAGLFSHSALPCFQMTFLEYLDSVSYLTIIYALYFESFFPFP